ncbi:glycosyltransferase [Thiocystis violacea]|uniref:glycosyltransferase n=1 Tax=Thiocystis violacea TaxID=13725 RepID=UPI001906A5C7|nr:glycosyltransferase [Thiocystis violacea]
MNSHRQEQPSFPPPLDLGDGPVIALAAHPGDEVFGCGGALARHVQEGQAVLVLIADGARDPDASVETASFLAESRAAGACLGYRDIRPWGESDPRATYDEPAVRWLMALIEETDPAILYAPAADDPDPARARLGLIARESVRRSATRCRLAVHAIGRPGKSNRLLDITPVLELKRRAMGLLGSRLAECALDRQTLALNGVDAFRLPAEVAAAEVFTVASAAEIADRIPGLASRMLEDGTGRAEPGPLVSVLVRTTRRDTLGEALDSIAAQTYRRIEVVLIDVRGTRDLGGAERCGEFPLRLASTGSPLGRGAAANLGLASALGDFVLFLDDDDWLLPEHIAGLVSAIQESPGASVAYAGIECRRATPQGDWEIPHVFNQPHDPVRLLVENYLPIHAVLFARALVGDALRFDESLEVYEDWDFWIQLSALTPFIHVERVTGVYRIHRSSGFGVRQDGDELDRGLAALLGKWRPRWSLDQLRGIVDHAKHQPMYRQLRDECAARHRALSEQLDEARLDREQWKYRHAILSAEKRVLEEQARGLHERILAGEARRRLVESARLADRERLGILGIETLSDAIECRDELIRYRSLNGHLLKATAMAGRPFQWPYRLIGSGLQWLSAPISRALSHAVHLAEITRAYGPATVGRVLGGRFKSASVPSGPRIGDLWRALEVATLNPEADPRAEVAILIDPTQVSAETIRLLRGLNQASHLPAFEILVLYPAGHPIGPLLEARLPDGRPLAYDARGGAVARLAAALDGSTAEWLFLMSFTDAAPRDWLSRLLGTARDVRLSGAVAGAVCAKVKGADGRLVEAGRRRSPDGRSRPIGAGRDIQASEYNYPREVDSASEAGLLLHRPALVEALGAAGDGDLDALLGAMRAGGRAILYEPEVTLVVAGQTGVPTGEVESADPDRRRVLVLDAVMLTPDQDSGSLRMFNLLETFLEQGWHVTFAPSNLEYVEPYGPRLQRRGVEVLAAPWIESIPAFLQRRGAEYELVILSRADVASQFIDAVKRYAPQARIWFDTVDLHFLREQREADLRGDPATLKRAAERKRQELDLMARTDLTLVVSSIERDLLAGETPDTRVEILSNIHDLHPTDATFAERDAILFIGGFNHHPNVDAVRYYLDEIQPLVEAELGRIPTFIIGSRPPIELLARDDPDRGLHVTGYVEDVTPYFERARLSIAPLRWGAGVKGKINMSMTFGVPVVATPCAAEGMSLQAGTDILIGADAAAFAAAVTDLYRDPTLWESVARHGLTNIEEHFSRRVARATLERLLTERDA